MTLLLFAATFLTLAALTLYGIHRRTQQIEQAIPSVFISDDEALYAVDLWARLRAWRDIDIELRALPAICERLEQRGILECVATRFQHRMYRRVGARVAQQDGGRAA
jgi:hypothetical protein